MPIRRCGLAVLATIAMLLSACSVAQLGMNNDFDRLPLNDLVAQAATAEPAEWNLEPPGGWPSHVPAPDFIDHTEVQLDLDDFDLEGLSPEEREIFENIDLTPRPGVSGSDGKRFFDLRTSTNRPSEDDVVAYMALLLSVGFEVDREAASAGFFVRDGIEWVKVANLPSNDYLRGGDYSIPDDRAGGFLVSWFENPVRSAGYCRIVEVGGDSCRE